MRSIPIILLQLQANPGADFVMKAGLLVIVLCGFIIYLTMLHRHKKNRMHIEQKIQEERFNEEILNNRIEVQEATFNSVGIELHDNVGQLISTALMLVNMTERDLEVVPPNLTAAAVTLNQSIIELRSLSKSLNKDWLEKFELEQNLFTEVERINTSGEILIELSAIDENLLLLPGQQFLIFRIIQEGIQNVLRHAKASQLKITIQSKPGGVEIFLKDNGVGFNTRTKTTGIGIPNIRQRALAMGGTAKWISNNSGTLLTISIPIKTVL